MEFSTDMRRRLSHAEILRLAIGGDRSAEEILAERLLAVPRILNAINARMGKPLSEHDVADLSQDTVVIVLRKLRQETPIEELEGWIYRVCSLEIMNALRRKRRQPQLLPDNVLPEPRTRLRDDPRQTWDFEDVDGGLRVLPADEAIVIRLKFFGDNTFNQIAARLEISQGTVKAQFYRGLMKLQSYLKTRYPEGGHAQAHTL